MYKQDAGNKDWITALLGSKQTNRMFKISNPQLPEAMNAAVEKIYDLRVLHLRQPTQNSADNTQLSLRLIAM
jgi:hypothetical protein